MTNKASFSGTGGGLSGVPLAPYPLTFSPERVQRSTTGTITVSGFHFTPDTTVRFDLASGVGEVIITDIRFINPSELEVDYSAPATDGFYDLMVVNSNGEVTSATQLEVFLSVWVDYTTAGVASTRVEARANYTLPIGAQDEVTAGLTRTVDGIHNSSTFSLWSHWVMFRDQLVARTGAGTFSFVWINSGGGAMLGIRGANGSPTSTLQYAEAEVYLYHTGTSILGLYGGGNFQSLGSVSAPFDSIKAYKAVFTNDGQSGGTVTIYEIPGRAAGFWDDVSTIIVPPTVITLPSSSDTPIMPAFTAVNTSAFKLIAAQVA